MAKTWFGKYINFLGKFFTMGAYQGNIADEINKALKGAEGKYLGTNLTPAEEQANQFSADQAQIQRDWESDEAVKAYERQREFYRDFQSPQAQVQQYQEAGLNPALMFGRGVTPASPVSGNQATGGASAQSVKPDSGDIGQLISLMANLGFRAKEIDIEKQLKGSQANYYNALAKSYENENSVFAEKYSFWKQIQGANILHISAQTFTEYAKEALMRQNISESEARTTLLHFQGLVAENDAKWSETLNQDLHRLRETASDLNIANSAEAWSKKDLTDEQKYQLQNTFNERLDILKSDMRKAAADAGISENEFNNFWNEYRLRELVTIGDVFEDFKGNFSVLGIGGTHNSFQNGMFTGGIFNPFGLPSLSVQ